jgi:hypothetical protein
MISLTEEQVKFIDDNALILSKLVQRFIDRLIEDAKHDITSE